jgi:hypothetical protein
MAGNDSAGNAGPRSVQTWWLRQSPWHVEPEDGWAGGEFPLEAFIGDTGFDTYETEDDVVGCPLVRDLHRGAFELAVALQDRRARPSEILALKGAADAGDLFWHFVDPRLSSVEEARLAGAIVLWECEEHILQVARFKGRWRVFSGIEDLPLDSLEQLEDEELIDPDDTSGHADDQIEASPLEDDLTEEDLELRRLRQSEVSPDE